MTTTPRAAVRMLLALLAAAVVGLGVLAECRGDALAMPDPPRPPQRYDAPGPPPTPVVTPYPWLTPVALSACGVQAWWYVAEGRTVHVFGRPVGTSGKWDWRWTLEGGTLLQPVGIQFTADEEWLLDVTGATATIWPTVDPDTPTPSPVATQTPWLVVVTATPEPTGTAPPAASPEPTRAVVLPVVLRPRARP